jgi:hypothetical protein
VVPFAGELLAAADTGLSSPIPAFARKYKTSCSTCHAAAPKLNVLGEAFRLNGYRFPENDALLRKEQPVPLGAEPWKELWPRAIWPGELPAIPPVSLRVVSDVRVTNDDMADYSWTYLFPNEIYALAGGTLGESIGFFVEAEWTQDEGIEVIQAKIPFQDPLPFLPDRSFNLWVGKQNLYLLTLGQRQIDRAERQRLLWGDYAISELVLRDPSTGDSLRSLNDLELRFSQPGIEINGIVSRRAYYALGVTQGSTDFAADNNDRKDFYYKLRYKLGGLALDGAYDPGGEPVLGTGGQLFDRSLIIEQFGYFGTFPVANDLEDKHHTLGIAARWLNGPLDLGAGYAWGQNDNPWGLSPAQQSTHWSAFLKSEYFFFPWLLGSLKVEHLETDVPEAVRAAGFTEGALYQSRFLPGAVALIRQNVRLVIEAELYSGDSVSGETGTQVPDNLWFRLDIAF